MVKYILVGGYPYKATDGGRAMCKDAVDGFTEPVHILICLFARPKELWNKLFDENKMFFTNNLPGIELIFVLANEDSFIDQISNSEVLYFSGGDTAELLRKLEVTPDWPKKLAGKTVMGSSAGTDILSTHCYDLESFECADGVGLVPVKTIVHYEAAAYTPPDGWKNAHDKLKQYKKELPIWKLREGEHRTMKL